MKLLDLTLPESIPNIALDEALIESAEANGSDEILRLWEPKTPIVVIGRSSPIRSEVNLRHCEKQGIAVVRRCSGGASIVTGPGCLMYAVLLDYRKRPELRSLSEAHLFVMSHMKKAIGNLGLQVSIQGTSDLTLGDKKFSGNSMRATRDWMIYHGTMLCSMNLDIIFQCLGTPDRQPDYRMRRSHSDFLCNLGGEIDLLRNEIRAVFGANQPLAARPELEAITNQLVAEKYSTSAWNYKR